MLILDLTLNSPAENLALDEGLLIEAEGSGSPREVLRIWEPLQPFVVLGSSSRFADEVNTAACREDHVPVLRRPSGGASIVTGPGCLMYAVILAYDHHPYLQAIDLAHRHVLGKLASTIAHHVPDVHHAGTSDLAIRDRKFSGNSMRAKRGHILYHGTLLYDFPLPLIGRYLTQPPRQPEYRKSRPHSEFLTNVPLARSLLVEAVIEAFDGRERLVQWPRERVFRLVAEKYSRDEWNRRL